MATLREPYRFRIKDQKICVFHHSAYTKVNPEWKWWKFWKQRFISVPAGYHIEYAMSGRIELDTGKYCIMDSMRHEKFKPTFAKRY